MAKHLHLSFGRAQRRSLISLGCDVIDSAVRPDPSLLTLPRNRFDNERLRLQDDAYIGAIDIRDLDCDVAIVGSGLAGMLSATFLRHAAGNRLDIRIIDPSSKPFAVFSERASSIDQRVMRSPFDHHLAPDGPMQLLDIARAAALRLTPAERTQIELAASGQRALVATDVFLLHCQYLSARYELQHSLVKARVDAISLNSGRQLTLKTQSNGRIRCRAVILALGLRSRKRRFPATRSVYSNSDHSSHSMTVAVIGRGMGAAHRVLKELEAGASVAWFHKGKVQYRCADVPTRFFRSDGLSEFQSLRVADRLRLLREYYEPTIIPEFQPCFEKFSREGRLSLIGEYPLEVQRRQEAYSIRWSGGTIRCCCCFESPGFTASHQLTRSVAPVQYGHLPAVSDDGLEVQSMPGVFIIGAAASLSVGPVARNIDGARIGIARIIPALAKHLGVRLLMPSTTGFAPILGPVQ